MNLLPLSAEAIATMPLPGPCALIRMADEPDLLPPVMDNEAVKHTLTLTFHDAHDAAQGIRPPAPDDARKIVAFIREANQPYLVAQCQAGVGRSVAVCMAAAKILGLDYQGPPTQNRRLYRLLLEAAGIEPEPEPLVSICVRVKYDYEYLQAFLLSLRRQRHDNWEAICFTDGLNAQLINAHLVYGGVFEDHRIRVLETPEPRGRWGHPYRQSAFEACLGEWIGTNNDDNYLTPGYIEQLVGAAEQTGAQLAVCYGVHRYSGWGVCPAGDDLACWLAKAELIRRVPWTGTGFTADREYLSQLIDAAGGNVVEVPRPLVVKN